MSYELVSLVAQSEPMPASGGQIEGNSPLKGNLDLISLLVRECVQNSWDARDDSRGDVPVHFSIDAWDLDANEVNRLKTLLPVTDLADDGFGQGVDHPRSILDRSALRVLVISDRNTVGLCGPTRSGTQWEPIRDGRPLDRGQPRFANFVRNTGRAVRNIGGGDGGAYGVGKSALWMASKCGTILIHTRTTDESGEPVERFIGSVHGHDFAVEKKEYTGRHFIGVNVADQDHGSIVEPLTGAGAALAASMLKIPSYEIDGEATDGTSILIVDPRLSLDWTQECRRIADAIRWHVWPKRVPGLRGDGSCADMNIALRLNGKTLDLPAPLDDYEIRHYAIALQHSATGRVTLDEPGLDLTLKCRRPQKDLGSLKFRRAGDSDKNVFHVTTTRSQLSSSADPEESFEPDAEPVIEFDKPWGQIALIRREPLLLVRYEPIGGNTEASGYVGVFLSADDPEVEDALTKAEPPAHNDWDYRNVQRESKTDHRPTFAKRTMEELKAARATFLGRFAATTGTVEVRGEQAVSAAISEGLFKGKGGKQGGSGGGGGSGGSRKPRAELRLIDSRADSEFSVHELEITLTDIGPDPFAGVLRAHAPAFDSAGRIDADSDVTFRWLPPGADAIDHPEIPTTVSDGMTLTLLVSVKGNLRVRPGVIVEKTSGS